MDPIDKFINSIDRIGLNFLKFFMLIGIITCIVGIISYFKNGDNETFKKGNIFTIVIIVMFIVSKIAIGAN
ncbi:hypothetical protein [Clostridium sp. Marseille-Q2269]|uniref:hypothetical protein n=1 Tax=Clostridium sp. Marseille-Q2269 TaxID=2942205 RepID=UPI002073799C|nr:hypothetical protein [Clostridium sp. Marseille-Q2269]